MKMGITIPIMALLKKKKLIDFFFLINVNIAVISCLFSLNAKYFWHC